MSWRDQWQQGSFRNVKFRFRTASATLGRRNVVHGYPGRDEPYIEDLGRKAREFTIEAFVLGDNYLAWRDELEAACEQPGPGELVHPTRGRMQVAVQDCRPQESIDAGGMASYSLTFIEAGNNKFPTVRADTRAQVATAADNALAAISADFASRFKVTGFPEFVGTSALASVNAALDAVYGATMMSFAQVNFLPGFYSELRSLQGNTELLLSLPNSLGGKLAAQIDAINDLFEPEHAYTAAVAVGGGYSGTQSTAQAATPSNVQQASNSSAVTALVQTSALVAASRASGSIEYASSNDAITVRDSLADRLDAAAETASDEVYRALTDLRVAVVRDIGVRAVDLPGLMTYTPGATLPAIVLAYQLYGDPERDAQIVSRNRIRHPGVVPGGQPIEVLL